jgi:GH15 family glucan-1,4-alpha-glucosidase
MAALELDRPSLAEPHVLREYAMLADGERGALVGPRGDVVWMCFPRWHDEAVFAALLGGRGSYLVSPRGRFVWGGYYEHGTLIWRSRWATETGIVECREALAAPGDPERAIVLRQVLARDAPARLDVLLDLRADYGRRPVRGLVRRDDGAWAGELGTASFCWTGAEAARVERLDDGAEGLVLRLELEPGESHDLVLALQRDGTPEPPEPERTWDATLAWWKDRVPEIGGTVAERDARHAYAVLAGLTSRRGGMVAAATTSLPERAEQGRNYDYRYVWVRDQCYAGMASARGEPLPLLDDAVSFLGGLLHEHGAELRPAYTVLGEPIPEERRLRLPGYPGGGDVVGNQVAGQFQLDVFGEALLMLAAAARHDRLDGHGWGAAEIAADAIERRWREPDAGLWEIELRRWTHGRLICAAGLRAIGGVAAAGERSARWLSLADTITAETSAGSVHRSGRWQRAPDDERLDAALLLPPVRGALAADDPRTLATLRAVKLGLASDGFVYRYRPDERPLGHAEGAFLLCGFFMTLACVQQGEQVAAARWFERSRSACGPPALLSEEFDVTQRQLRGNLPQAFVHALLLESAIAQWEERDA